VTEAALGVRNLELAFGGVRPLKGVSLDARKGQVTGVIGPNGAGKTSLLNCLSGLYRPAAGTIAFEGRNIAGLPAAEQARSGIARTFQSTALSEELSVLENVLLGRFAQRKTGWLQAFLPLPGGRAEMRAAEQQARGALETMGIAKLADEPVETLAPGFRRLVEISRALAAAPRLLLLDEPAAGLNSAETADLGAILAGLRSPDLAMLLVEHDMELVMSLCDRIVVLNFGEVIAIGAPEEIRRHAEVIRIYLGADHE
jgi:branched-chain amino acid transport system ATP-binding protein